MLPEYTTKFRVGSIGNQHKCTFNWYDRRSRIVVNGVKTDKFAENVLPIILKLIASNESEPDSINLYSTEMDHNNTSVNNLVKKVLHLGQQEPAIELRKDKNQSTLTPQEGLGRTQHNIRMLLPTVA